MMAPSLPLAGRLPLRLPCPHGVHCSSSKSSPPFTQLRGQEPAQLTAARALPPGLAAEQSALYRQTEDATDRASAKYVDEYRRAAGVCLVRDGLVFAARYARSVPGPAPQQFAKRCQSLNRLCDHLRFCLYFQCHNVMR